MNEGNQGMRGKPGGRLPRYVRSKEGSWSPGISLLPVLLWTVALPVALSLALPGTSWGQDEKAGDPPLPAAAAAGEAAGAEAADAEAAVGKGANNAEPAPAAPTAPAESTAAKPAGEGSPAAQAEDDATYLGPLRLTGSLDQRYRFRKSGGDRDQDVYGNMNLTAEYPGKASREDLPFSKLLFNLQSSYTLDIDGFQDTVDPSSSSFFPFFDVSNTWSDRMHGYLYEANLEAKDISFLDTLKAGRQTIYREANIIFDGAYARTQRWNTLSFDVYGGVPAHFYESSPQGDALGGAGVESAPLPGLRLGADYLYVKDNSDDVPNAFEHFYRLYGRYNFLREWTVLASGSWNDTRDRRQSLELRYLSDAVGFLGQFRFLRQNGIVEFQPSEFSPYVYVMGEYAPYFQYMLDLHQPIGEKFGIGAGLNFRHLEDYNDNGLYNHSFENFYLSFDVAKLWDGMRANLQGDIWESNEQDVYTLGFELEQAFEICRIRAGTGFSLYRIDPFTGEETDRDRVYYVKVRWHLMKHLDLDTEYTYERNSESEYHIALGGLRIWF